MTFKAFVGLLKKTAAKWSDCNAPRLGASLAFYMLLSLAPLLILVVALCGFVFSAATAQDRLLAEVHSVAGPAGERTVRMLISSAARPKSGIVATVVALVTLFSGASGVFLELRDALNTIWSAKRRGSSNWRSFVHHRLSSFGMVLALGLVLTLSLVLSTGIAAFERLFLAAFPIHVTALGQLANVLSSLVAIAILFALIFKYVPDVPITWRDVGIGAGFTSILFTVGKGVLGVYFATVGVGSTYGAAGSLVALIIWVYYSAQIFFFGAIFTHEYATQFGSRAKNRNGNVPESVQLKVRSQTA
ncbi:MAG: YihY/virulence factor BrkB family protein [Bryobacteraceae bacterium]